jgi:AbrB family looped-hinge helix DNA binding protein
VRDLNGVEKIEALYYNGKCPGYRWAGGRMQTVTMSSKYQIVIPREIREKHQLKPGKKFIVMSIGDRIELVPEKSMKEMRGILRGMDTDIDREREDRL